MSSDALTRLNEHWTGVGNRQVSHELSRAEGAPGEKGARGGNRVSPAGARRSRATGVEVDL